VVGRKGENFGVEKRWKKNIHVGKEDGIFVHPQNSFNGLILNWCIGGYWFTPARQTTFFTQAMCYLMSGWVIVLTSSLFLRDPTVLS
jgi:hypothetical protein